MIRKRGARSRAQSLSEYVVLLAVLVAIILGAIASGSTALGSAYASIIGGDTPASSPTPTPVLAEGEDPGDGGGDEDPTPGPVTPCSLTAAFSATEQGASGKYQFTDLSTGGPTIWAWDFGDASTSSSRNPQHNYSHNPNITYTVVLVISNGSCAVSSVRSLTIRPGNDPSPTPVPTPSPTPVPTPACVAVPSINDLAPSAANSALSARGLTANGIGDLTSGPKSKAKSQSPSAGACVAAGSTVTYRYRPPFE